MDRLSRRRRAYRAATTRRRHVDLSSARGSVVVVRMAQQAITMWPDLPLIMQANRAFLRRAVRFCLNAGIRQFLDLGSGILTVGNVHEVAQQTAPDARVVYVDGDPIAVAHSHNIVGANQQTAVVQAASWSSRTPARTASPGRPSRIRSSTGTPAHR